MPKKTTKQRYITTWGGDNNNWCSSHYYKKDAVREAARCEREGGKKHRIWKRIK